MLFVCPQGAEAHLEAELRRFGAEQLRTGRAQVRCLDAPHEEEAHVGGLRVAMQACLSSHVASRVLWPIARFAATEPKALYTGARAVAWDRLLTAQQTFAIRTRRGEGELGHGPFVAQVVKDALVDCLRDACGERPSVERQQPDVLVHVVVHHGEVELFVDLSGDSLHERGIREAGGAAPLKEHVAALVLLIAGWPERAARGEPFVDPMCGSGTLLVEAALMARGMPPRAWRSRFGIDGLPFLPQPLWHALQQRARERYEAGRTQERPSALFGYDADFAQIQRARRAFARVQLEGDATLEVADISRAVPAALQNVSTPGLVVANTPYGERIGGERAMVEARLHAFGRWLKALPGWHASVLVGERDVGFSLGLRAHKIHALKNGALDVSLLHLRIGDHAEKTSDENEWRDSDFARRVAKNEKHRRKMAEREGMGAYRVYDADVPEYRPAVDVYEAADGSRHIYLQPYAAPKTVDAQRAEARVRHMVLALPHALDVSPRCVHVTERNRQRDSQYGHKKAEPRFFWIKERGMSFCVSLDAYVDTGLYLDLREVRAYMRKHARGKHVLNVFGYTGSMSVAAAMGGAVSTVTVDKSNRYLDWAAQNFSANGMDRRQHELVRADVLPYLVSRGPSEPKFDLIYIGAPTYSSGKMGSSRAQFDVVFDHAELLQRAMALLAPGGECWFSTHRKGFRLDESVSVFANVKEESERMIPADFVARRPYRIWRLTHRIES